MAKKLINVLLVEDNRGDAFLVEEMLNKTINIQFNIVHEETLDDTETRLQKEDFDVILLDLGLSDSWGLNTFHKVYSVAEDVPIIIYTGLDDDLTAFKAIKKGAYDYLVKGQIDSDILLRALRYGAERYRRI